MRELASCQLYLVLTEVYGKGRSVLEVAEHAVTGGIDLLQMREKDRSREERLRLGRELRALCRANNVRFIVNDDPSLAKELDADGVHLGQEDLLAWPLEKVRALLGRDRLIGLSTHSLGQFEKGQGMDTDYLAFGPIFPTKAKDYCIGMEEIPAVLASAVKPVFFIGGIDGVNLATILEAGVTRIALIRDLVQAPDISARVRWYQKRLQAIPSGIQVRLNGRVEILPEGVCHLQDLVAAKRLGTSGVVIECNQEVVPRERWALTELRANDRIEIVCLVGGG